MTSMSKNNLSLRARRAVRELGQAYANLTKKERAQANEPLLVATIELLASLTNDTTPQPSPNQALILRAIYWLPEREAEEIVHALDELEDLRNNGRTD